MQPSSNRQTITATVIAEKGVSQTSISIQDERWSFLQFSTIRWAFRR